MPNKGLYIPDSEMPLWNAAARVAKKHRVSLYRVVAEALKHDLARADAEGPIAPTSEWNEIAAEAA